MKMYVNFKDLNDYEKENNRISYKRLVERYFNNMILCNNIVNNYEDLEIVAGSDYDEEEGTYKDIYQYFIVDGCFNDEALQKVGKELGVVYYNSNLDIYILGVDHLGTSWNYVLTDIEPTEDYEESI